jgi:hypothetical protein
MSAKTPLYVIGYAPHENIIDPEILADFADFPVGMQIELEVGRAMLERGVYPPGLVLYCNGGKPGVIRGVYGNERLEAWE